MRTIRTNAFLMCGGRRCFMGGRWAVKQRRGRHCPVAAVLAQPAIQQKWYQKQAIYLF